MAELVGEVVAVDVLEHEEQAAVVGQADRVQADDVRVREHRVGLGLALEAGREIGGLRDVRVQALDRDGLPALVDGPVDHAHAALTQLLLDREALE